MENKVLIELFIPNLDLNLDLYIPTNKRIGNVIMLITKALLEIDQNYIIPESAVLYNRYTSKKYLPNDLVGRTDIRNGAYLLLI